MQKLLTISKWHKKVGIENVNNYLKDGWKIVKMYHIDDQDCTLYIIIEKSTRKEKLRKIKENEN